jgi:coiled-coil domain-containing protein 130
MSSLSATQSDGYYLPPEYFESGAYKKVSRNRFAAETEASERDKRGKKLEQKPSRVGHNQWLKHGVVRFELPEKASAPTNS